MSTEANKALIRRWAEGVMSKGDLNMIDELFATDYLDHTNPPDWPAGSVGHKQIIALYHTAFRDFRYTIEHQVAEGDLVMVRGTYHGTHSGTFFGIPPTEVSITTTGMHLFRVAGGKITEHWCNNDDLGVMRQLGVIPER